MLPDPAACEDPARAQRQTLLRTRYSAQRFGRPRPGSPCWQERKEEEEEETRKRKKQAST
eukprot:9473838-Pyramimonas_sp.AAC.1